MTQQGCVFTLLGLFLLFGGLPSCGAPRSASPNPGRPNPPIQPHDSIPYVPPQAVRGEALPPVPSFPAVDPIETIVKKEIDEKAERLRASQAERERKKREEAENAEEAMVRYELAKAEYHAAVKLTFARVLAEDARKHAALGNTNESDRLRQKAVVRFKELIERYAETQAAADAAEIVAGREVPARPYPPAPVLPQLVRASEEDIRELPAKDPTPAADARAPRQESGSVGGMGAIGRFGTVHVRGYTRSDGTYVRPHVRSAPGSGGGRGGGRR